MRVLWRMRHRTKNPRPPFSSPRRLRALWRPQGAPLGEKSEEDGTTRLVPHAAVMASPATRCGPARASPPVSASKFSTHFPRAKRQAAVRTRNGRESCAVGFVCAFCSGGMLGPAASTCRGQVDTLGARVRGGGVGGAHSSLSIGSSCSWSLLPPSLGLFDRVPALCGSRTRPGAQRWWKQEARGHSQPRGRRSAPPPGGCGAKQEQTSAQAHTHKHKPESSVPQNRTAPPASTTSPKPRWVFRRPRYKTDPQQHVPCAALHRWGNRGGGTSSGRRQGCTVRSHKWSRPACRF